MSKGTKITSFFEGRRREVFLSAWTHLKTKAGESRIKLELSMPLLNRSLQAMPDAVSKQFAVMCEDKSATGRANLGIFAEGMTLDFFSTDESKNRALSCTGVMLKKFQMVNSGEGDKRELSLMMVAYAPANVLLRDYAWDTNHGTFFLESTYSQTEMLFGEEPADELDTGDNDEDEPEPAAASADIFDFDETQPEPAFVS